MALACSAECAGFSTVDEDLPLNCPGCKATIAEGTAICPACDYILDTSFLSSEPPESDEATPPPASERTNVGPAPTAPPARQVPRRTMSGSRPAAKAAPRQAQRSPRGMEEEASVEVSADAAPASGATRVKSLSAIEAERPRTRSRTDAPRSPSRAVARAAPRQEEPELPEEPGTDPGAQEVEEPREDWQDEHSAPDKAPSDVFKPEESLDGIKEFIAALHTSDKLTFIGVVGLLISCVLPWQEHVRDGDSMGFMTLGVVAAVAACVALGALVVRVRGNLPTLNPVFPWLLQLGATGFGTLWCLIFFRLAYDGRKVPALVGAGMVSVSTPSSGAIFGLMFMLLALGGTLMGLREKQD